MKLRIAVASLFVLLLVALPFEIRAVSWQSDPAQYPRYVRWAGCHAEMVADPGTSPVGSYYSPSEQALVVGTMEDTGIPYYAGLFVLFHETGHCLQDQEGLLADLGYYDVDKRVSLELDADRRAADLMCGMGLDGRRIVNETFDWAHDQYGYTGDWQHGTLEQRKHQGDLATSCDRHVES